MSLLKDFQKFIMRGNVVDLAVAVILGVAFGKIISSLVDGIIMPLIGVLLGGVDIAAKTAHIGQAVIKWGAFLQSLLDFLIIAFAVFLLIKMLSALRVPKVSAELSPQEVLLTEIRDILKTKMS